jgi:predicted nucleic acid-binding protein
LPTPPSIKVFVDSSVFFAAAYSQTGSARDLFLAALGNRVTLVVSSFVLTETRRNLERSAPQVLPSFERLRDSIPLLVIEPTEGLVRETTELINPKDAPIVAGARTVNATHLATYDKRDLLSRAELILASYKIEVTTPEAVLASVQEKWPS